MTEKNIFICEFVIENLDFNFFLLIATLPWKKLARSFPATPSQS